ncbi:MAG TPA: response regulator transcription factor [Anaeromyxobacteraceae bacterium]|nr:response regulator transcription factor [Anaeromyxobacteraceae bacterium]
MEALRAAIVSEDPLTRTGLAALLAGRADLAIAGGLAPGDPEALARLRADVALFETRGPNPEGLRALTTTELPVVVLVTSEVQAAEAIAAGARGTVFRDAEADRMAAALVGAARGLVVLEGAFAAWLRPPPPTAADAEGLTPREAEVLSLLAEGLANKTIAQRLGISERTAKFHVESILGKLGAESRSEAIVIAARMGMVTL